MRVLDNGLVSDDFTIERDGRVFRDALVMPAADYAALSADDIAALKEARFSNWLAVVVEMENRAPAEDQ